MRFYKAGPLVLCSSLLLTVIYMTCWPSHGGETVATKSEKKKNVIVIIADDMRAEIGAFEDQWNRPWMNRKIQTPNLDKLAAKSMIFKRAYVQQAQCNPSRTSVLTGRRPDTTHVTDNHVWFRDTGNPNITTLPLYFRDNDYKTYGLGKVYHLLTGTHQDIDYAWTKFKGLEHVDFKPISDTQRIWKSEKEGTKLVDHYVTENALDMLDVAANDNTHGQPFFMAVGYRRPHLPWHFPVKYLNLYSEEDIEIPENMYAPFNMPVQAWFRSTEFLNHIPSLAEATADEWHINSTLSYSQIKEFRRAYYSSITHVDNEIGRFLDQVEALGMLDNSIIVFFGDHGWQLGEHGIWGKETNFETATHAPLMVRIPGVTDGGRSTNALVEFVDIFPTLTEAAGLPPPPTCDSTNPLAENLCVEGTSLVPLIKSSLSTWKKAVFSQFPFKGRPRINVDNSMGYSMRTDHYRYTEWWRKQSSDKVDARQLFDMRVDPLEQYNRVDDERYSDIVEELAAQLRAGWRAALPELTTPAQPATMYRDHKR